ncbi:hypothetical protein M885DRAFT_179543 [Pelagophyceae sp. CCMP2097]|nr:hypothetical protein M885DRAFT_179543 [Pelagophyceae sp. CCMP2097]
MGDHGARALLRGWTQRPIKAYSFTRPRGKKETQVACERWNIVRGDKVTVINGPFQGQGGVVKVVIRKNNRLIVEGVNVGVRRLYDSTDEEKTIRRVQEPRSIHYSNVNLVELRRHTNVGEPRTNEGV